MDYYLWPRVIAARTWRGVQTADRDDLLQEGALAAFEGRRVDGAMWDWWRWWTGWGRERQEQNPPKLRRLRRKCPKDHGRANGRGAHWTDVSLQDDTPMLMRELEETIAKAVATHDKRTITWAVDYYARGSFLNEIAMEAGVSESRVCQILRPVREVCLYARSRYFGQDYDPTNQ